MKDKLYAKIQQEFNNIADTFIEKEIDLLADENLITFQSKYNLHEIQPYYAELANEVLSSDAKLTIESEEDFNPVTDDLYEYKINLENRRAYLKRQHYGGGIFYSTIYEYTEEYHKSYSVYQNKEIVKMTNLSYLYLKEGLPHKFVECTQYGISLKTYRCEGEFIKSYKLEWPHHDQYCIGELEFNQAGILQTITESVSDGRVRIIFDRSAADKDIEKTLIELENFLVENIADQILEKIKISEPVYCILFEYTMQGPFPPTIAFGTISDIDEEFENKKLYELYNAPDMKYFSEQDGQCASNIDFYPEEIQANYLAIDNYTEKTVSAADEVFVLWENQIFETYLKVCKRLMHFDFSKSFTPTEHFLVMARDFDQGNEEAFYKKMQDYKKTKLL